MRIAIPLLLLAGACGRGDALAPEGTSASNPPSIGVATDASTGPAGTWGTAWVRLAADRLQQEPLSAPRQARVLAYLGVALYEGVAATTPGAQRLAGLLRDLPTLPSAESEASHDPALTVAAAGGAVLEALLPATSAVAVVALRDSQVARRRQIGIAESKIERSLRLGQEIGQAIIGWSEKDGFAETLDRPYAVPSGPGLFVPSAAPIDPYFGELRPFLDTACRAEEPFAFSVKINSDFYADAEAVYFTSLDLDENKRTAARYWQDDVRHWARLAAQISDDQEERLLEALSTQAQGALAMAEALIGVFEVKYHHNLLRPETYIGRYIVSGWRPLLETPDSPEYVSSGAAVAAAMSTVLTARYGDHYALNDRAAQGFEPRAYDSFESAASEAAEAELWGGIAFPMGVDEGLRFGRCHGDDAAALLP